MAGAHPANPFFPGDNLQTAVTVARHSGMISGGSKVILVEASEPEATQPPSVTWQLVEETQPPKGETQVRLHLTDTTPRENKC